LHDICIEIRNISDLYGYLTDLSTKFERRKIENGSRK
jgi:hypothetical protein